MSTDLVHHVGAPAAPAVVHTPEAEALIREQFGLQEATTTELEYLFAVAQRLGLDPVTRQIYGVMRWDSRANRNKLTVQVGIDGLRLAAERTGTYAGQDDAVFRGTTTAKYPAAATVTVYKIVQGVRCPFTATARWDEYCQTNRQGQPMGQWPRMPHVMLAKCAEALALRKAFPAELGGVYSDVEMQQGEVVEAERVPLTDLQKATLREMSERAGVDRDVAERRIESMTASDYAAALASLEQRIVEQDAVGVVEDAEVAS